MADPGWSFIQKFVIVGHVGVGKTSVLNRLTDKAFDPESEATIGVDYGSRIVELENGKRTKLQIWDTGGSEAFRSITRSYYRGAEGCLLVFDVTSRASYQSSLSWLNDVREFAEENVVIILVANKIDLAERDDDRAVSADEARAFAAEHGIEYFETSAKTGVGIEEAFESIARRIHAQTKGRQARAGSFPASRSGGASRGSSCC